MTSFSPRELNIDELKKIRSRVMSENTGNEETSGTGHQPDNAAALVGDHGTSAPYVDVSSEKAAASTLSEQGSMLEPPHSAQGAVPVPPPPSQNFHERSDVSQQIPQAPQPQFQQPQQQPQPQFQQLPPALQVPQQFQQVPPASQPQPQRQAPPPVPVQSPSANVNPDGGSVEDILRRIAADNPEALRNILGTTPGSAPAPAAPIAAPTHDFGAQFPSASPQSPAPSPYMSASSSPRNTADARTAMPRASNAGDDFGFSLDDAHAGGDTFALESHRLETPKQGWRKTVSKMGIPVGKSETEKEYDKDIALINKQLRYPRIVGIAGFKGGVGKSVCTVCLGSSIGEHRATGAVVGIDADENGTLPLRMKGQQVSDVKSFAADDAVNNPSDMQSHMLSNQHRFSVLGSSLSQTASPLSAKEYSTAVSKIKKFSNVSMVLVDMDTSAASPSYEEVMRSLNALVIVVAPTLESAKLGKTMISWIREHDLGDLLSRTVVLINHNSPSRSNMNVEDLITYFKGQEHLKVLRVPWDEHLAEAGPVSLDLLNKTTRRRYVRLAAMITESLPPA